MCTKRESSVIRMLTKSPIAMHHRTHVLIIINHNLTTSGWTCPTGSRCLMDWPTKRFNKKETSNKLTVIYTMLAWTSALLPSDIIPIMYNEFQHSQLASHAGWLNRFLPRNPDISFIMPKSIMTEVIWHHPRQRAKINVQTITNTSLALWPDKYWHL